MNSADRAIGYVLLALALLFLSLWLPQEPAEGAQVPYWIITAYMAGCGCYGIHKIARRR